MGPAAILERVLTTTHLARPALWAATSIARKRHATPHWFVTDLAAKVDYRAPVDVKLKNGMTITVPWLDAGGRAIADTGWYEPETVDVLTSLLKPGMTFIDVGAAFGQYTLLAASLVAEPPQQMYGGPMAGLGQVIAYEPEPVSYAMLCKNVKRNKLSARCTLFPKGLDREKATRTLYIGSPDNVGSTSLAKPYNTAREVQLEVAPLDQEIGFDHLHVMKIDVEGAELDVLVGATRVLESHRPALVIEFEETNQARFGRSCRELATYLQGPLGYRLESILESGRVPYSLEHPRQHYTFNVLATPE